MADTDNSGMFDKLEFWALTAAFILGLPLFLDGDIGATIRYMAIFLAALFVDFRVVPALIRKERVSQNVLVLFCTYAFLAIVSYITHTFISGNFVPVESLLVVPMILFHLMVKHLAVSIISKADTLRSFFVIINRDGLVAFGLWMIISYWIWIAPVPTEVRLAWTTVIPTGILLHSLAYYWFIPSSLGRKYSLILYFFKIGLFCLVMGFVTSILVMVATGDEDHSFAIGGFNGVINMIFTAPALLLVYRWQMRGKEQITALQNELGRSTANLDFLRSQINPHFLFNALNTIYGLAIQEKAERTSASVEKLGDMMRFMLLENMQERISLKRELEYLDNYISLQRLRTDSQADIMISVQIQQEINPATRISPMLLIPFIENAFKHGISLREKSYIRISLELNGPVLYFDVSNSKHGKTDNDPEKNSNGIGLENVRQRLKHMYPKKHELVVRETNSDFFVHLRVELNQL